MANENQPAVKQYYDYAKDQIDEQAILDKFNAATLAQFNVQREQNRQNENAFYNQMYNTQKTAMDTIRQSNAAAVSSGASRGVQAANELSALLGLEQESVASATELANANRQTAQEETAAVLENMLNAYKQAQQERSTLTQQGIEAASLSAAATQASAQQKQADTAANNELSKAAETNTESYLAEVARQNKDYATTYSLEGANSLNQALSSLTAKGEGQANDGIYFNINDYTRDGVSTAAKNKYDKLNQNLNTIAKTYGITDQLAEDTVYQDALKAIKDTTEVSPAWSNSTLGVITNILKLGQPAIAETIAREAARGDRAATAQKLYNVLLQQLQAAYNNKQNQ